MARIVAMSDLIDVAVLALWLLFTTSNPPNCRRFQSASTAAVRLPVKPTMITAPISSSKVRPPGPSFAVGLADSEGEGDALEGVGVALETGPGPPHEMISAASNAGTSRLVTTPPWAHRDNADFEEKATKTAEGYGHLCPFGRVVGEGYAICALSAASFVARK